VTIADVGQSSVRALFGTLVNSTPRAKIRPVWIRVLPIGWAKHRLLLLDDNRRQGGLRMNARRPRWWRLFGG
jgi:hypothetical protein